MHFEKIELQILIHTTCNYVVALSAIITLPTSSTLSINAIHYCCVLDYPYQSNTTSNKIVAILNNI